jgi:hypothetical protein
LNSLSGTYVCTDGGKNISAKNSTLTFDKNGKVTFKIREYEYTGTYSKGISKYTINMKTVIGPKVVVDYLAVGTGGEMKISVTPNDDGTLKFQVEGVAAKVTLLPHEMIFTKE